MRTTVSRRASPRTGVCLASALLIGAALAACDSSYGERDPKTGVPTLPYPGSPREAAFVQGRADGAGRLSAALTATTTCAEVASALEAQLKAAVAAATQDAFAAAWLAHDRCRLAFPWEGRGTGGGGWSSDAGAAGSPSASYSPADESSRAASDAPAHSETNTQVAGVDEADIVKTDGIYLYAVTGNVLRVIKAWPAHETRVTGTVLVEGSAKKLFLEGDRLVLYSSIPPRTTSGELDSGPYGGRYGYGGAGECTYGYDCVPTGDGQATRISVFDLSQPDKPELVREIELSGSLLAARRIGGTVYTVVTEPAHLPAPNQAAQLHPDGLNDVCSATKAELYEAYKELLARNLEEVRAITPDDVFPHAKDSAGESPFGSCAGFYRASVNDGQQFTSIISLDLEQQTPLQATTILSPPGVVYSSSDALYLAVPHRRASAGWYEGLDGHDDATAIHKFALKGAEQTGADYSASGVIKGRILNQFALDEHEAHLRVASTTGHIGGGEDSAYNTLTVLGERAGRLELVGVLDKLAPTEDIRSVRFDGDRGYVVTFKKTDPLFVLDLAKPAAPRVLGELKIPGFSTYMHKMDDTHLLTIGYDADDQGSFAWFTGVMLQIFDVSEPTQPRLKFKHVIGTRGSSSEALTNHLAFSYYAPKNILSLPMTICEDSAGGGSYGMDLTFSGLMVFDVTTSAGFSLRGKVSHPLPEHAGCHNWWTQASSQVKRSLVIDNYVYSLSDSQLKVNDLDNLVPDLATVPLEEAPPL